MSNTHKTKAVEVESYKWPGGAISGPVWLDTLVAAGKAIVWQPGTMGEFMLILSGTRTINVRPDHYIINGAGDEVQVFSQSEFEEKYERI